uniref:Integrase catalytic domain-containing protein n=1 Tax=Mycena chlorophos TaxID=658473 RepID=A0ABQ0KWU7_MYCCL|nr:predicted protein [Mycena chlorophos]
MSDNTHKLAFPKLNENNYGTWTGDIRAECQRLGVWLIVKGSVTAPTSNDADEIRRWLVDSGKAAGAIFASLENTQRVHVKGMEENPVAMWNALERIHRQKRPGTRFTAYNDLFSIEKRPEETLTQLIGRVDTAITLIQDLRPSAHTLQDLDDELASIAMIRALPEEYKSFRSSLFLLPQLDKATVTEAFVLEEADRKAQAKKEQELALAMKAAVDAQAAAAAAATGQPSQEWCDWCEKGGHTTSACRSLARAKTARRNNSQQNKDAKAPQTQSASIAVTEFAGNASRSVPLNPSSPLLAEAGADWNTDTGATSHMTPHRRWFATYEPHRVPIRLADNKIVYSAGVGSVRFQPLVDGALEQMVEFERVLHVPDLRSNLLSVLYLTRQKRFIVTIARDLLTFRRDGKTLFTASINEHNTAYLDGYTVPAVEQHVHAATTLPLTVSLWHRRLGHIGMDYVKMLKSRDLVLGMQITSSQPPDPICEPCLAGKQHRGPIPKHAEFRATQPLELVHVDLKGPLPVRSREGYQYWTTFIDDYRRVWVTFKLKKKSEFFKAMCVYKVFAEKYTGYPLKALREDKGGEFVSHEMRRFCQEHGIRREHTVRNEPHQNGVAEIGNRVMLEHVTAMLSEANLPPSFWGYAADCFTYLHNRSPTAANPDMSLPYSSWNKGRKPNLSNLRVFGCTAYVNVQKNERRGIASHTKKCIFLGYPQEYKGWIFWHPETKKELIRDRADFDERYFPGLRQSIPNAKPDVLTSLYVPDDVVDAEEHGGKEPEAAPLPPTSPQAQASPPASRPESPFGGNSPLTTPPETPPPPRRVYHRRTEAERLRDAIPPFLRLDENPRDLASYDIPTQDDDEIPVEAAQVVAEEIPESAFSAGMEYVYTAQEYLTIPEAFEFVHAALAASAHDTEPRTYAEAMRRPDSDRYHQAACEEIEALIANGTFELVKLPEGRKVIGSRWVFKVKRNADGTIERYKGRVVAMGNHQRPGLDFDDTFAPTPKWSALRAILAIAALEDLELESVDISSAFLNGEINSKVYMRQPEGFVERDSSWVWKLIKSIYGLKQASRIWHKKLDETLRGLGFQRVSCEHSVWVWKRGEDRVIVPVFVDDITIASKNQPAVAKLKNDLKSAFKLRDLGPTSFLLGVEVIRDRPNRTLSLSQRQYTLDILERFGLADCNPVTTPLDADKLAALAGPLSEEDANYMRDKPYVNATGALSYLANVTRPDIAYAVGVLCRFNANPGPRHWKAVKHLMKYLKGTVDLKLTYAPNPHNTELFTTYSDADHGGNPDNGRSTSGMVVKIGTGAISWHSRLQTIVTLSTTEAEYVAACSAGMEIMYLRNLFTEFGYDIAGGSTLHVDNQSAIAVAKNPEHHGRMKHLDLRFYWLREAVERGIIAIVHLPGVEMPADLLTKALGRVKVEDFRAMMGLR